MDNPAYEASDVRVKSREASPTPHQIPHRTVIDVKAPVSAKTSTHSNPSQDVTDSKDCNTDPSSCGADRHSQSSAAPHRFPDSKRDSEVCNEVSLDQDSATAGNQVKFLNRDSVAVHVSFGNEVIHVVSPPHASSPSVPANPNKASASPSTGAAADWEPEKLAASNAKKNPQHQPHKFPERVTPKIEVTAPADSAPTASVQAKQNAAGLPKSTQPSTGGGPSSSKAQATPANQTTGSAAEPKHRFPDYTNNTKDTNNLTPKPGSKSEVTKVQNKTSTEQGRNQPPFEPNGDNFEMKSPKGDHSETNVGPLQAEDTEKAVDVREEDDGYIPCCGPGYGERLMRTLALYLTIVALGFSNGQRGPTLLDLQLLTDTDTAQASYYVTSGFIGYMVGGLGGGVIFDMIGSGNAPLLFACLGAAATVGTLALCRSFGLMFADFLLNAACLGVIDSCANAELLRLWRAKGRPYLQALHFSYAVGGFISPLYTEPFLAPRQSANSTNHSGLSNVTTAATNTLEQAAYGETQVVYAFLITAIFSAVIALPFFVFAIKDANKSKNTYNVKEGGASESQKEAVTDAKVEVKAAEKKTSLLVPVRQFLLATFLLLAFEILYVPTEHMFPYYLLTFVVKELDWSKTDASILNTVFWASWAVSRFTGIFITNCLSPAKLLAICCGTLVVGFVGFLVCSVYHLTAGVWIFTGSVGLSMSIVFPTVFLWVEENLMQVNGKFVASIMVTVSLGNIANPPLYGYLMENISYLWFSYLLLIESAACTFFLGTLFLYNKTVLSKSRQQRQQSITIQ